LVAACRAVIAELSLGQLQDLHLQPPFQLLDGQVCQQVVIEGLDVEWICRLLAIFHSFASLYSVQLRLRYVTFFIMTKKACHATASAFLYSGSYNKALCYPKTSDLDGMECTAQ
jgi:hypothetical protein